MPFDDYRKIDAYSKRYSTRNDEIRKIYEFRQKITDEMKNKCCQTNESMFNEPQEIKEIKLDLIDKVKKDDYPVWSNKKPKEKCINIALKEKIQNRYNKNPLEDLNLMTKKEQKIHSFLAQVSILDQQLKLPIKEQNRVSDVITVYREHKPKIDKFFEENCKITQDAQTQTNESKSYLIPLYQTRLLNKNQRIDNRLRKQLSVPIYTAYNFKNCPYVRVYQKKN
jgi:hypothetical protein